MPLPIGPLSIGNKGQITLPAALLRQLKLEPGDPVYADAKDDRLEIIPGRVIDEMLRLGAAARQSAGNADQGAPSVPRRPRRR